MLTYGGMGHYYVNQKYDRRCPTCRGKGYETYTGFTVTCVECNGTGVRPDPKLPAWGWAGLLLVLLLTIFVIIDMVVLS